jgi:hypothetical protein
MRFAIVMTVVMIAYSPVARAQPASVFEKDVLPIFEARCLRCHGEKKQKGGLDLRTKSATVRGGDNGHAVVAKSLKDSLLWEKIRTDEMPEGPEKLTPAEKDVVRRWIEAGALGSNAPAPSNGGLDLQISEEDRAFWAFQSPKRPAVPAVGSANPIDAFIVARLRAKGLNLSPPAERTALLRRVTFDLIGMPPSPEAVNEFLAAKSPEAAYARMVDRLLDDPRYGERWARHWLDVAGYADSEGILDADHVRTAAWRYRDYVIRAFNSDKPYDRFLLEQIAGDELVDYWNLRETQKKLPAAVVEALEATGFLRCASDTSRPDFVNIKNAAGYYFQTLDDTLKIVASSTMGLTLQCAKCHSHKYDPIPQADYYRMQAIFMSGYRPAKWIAQAERRLFEASAAQEREAKAINDSISAAVREVKKRQSELQAQYAVKVFESELAKLPPQIREDVTLALNTDIVKRNDVQKYLVSKFEAELKPPAAVLLKRLEADADFGGKFRKLVEEINGHERGRRSFPEIRAFYDLPGEATTNLLRRGDYLTPGPEVTPGVLRVLSTAKGFTIPPREKDAKSSGRRLAFAQWLTKPDHPLTARVMVNRLWLHHFGQGLVATPDNFGKTGSPPSHPELLDWLATEFAAKGWSIKAMHRLIVLSDAYKQQSTFDGVHHAEAKKIDPDNRLLWRQRLRRLEGEAIRDAILSVSGQLNPQAFGPPAAIVRSGDGEVNAAADASGNRRSIYLQVRRSQPLTFLQLFDQPVIETNCTRRETSTVASQALTLLNSDFMIRQAEAFADRILKEAGDDPAGWAIVLALGRHASDRERRAFARFLDDQTLLHVKTQPPAEARRRAIADLCHMLLSANEFAYVD